MRVVYFTHSLISDWNHGNAHFIRGILAELEARGHDTMAWEPRDGWSRAHLRRDAPGAEADFARQFPQLRSRSYETCEDVDRALDAADLVLVHEWTDPEVVAAIGRRRAAGGGFLLFFHDTHHRAVSAAREMANYDLTSYDGVLAFGEALREIYLARGWGRKVWTWHEAADTRVFRPRPEIARAGEVVWIGNWGDGERADELDEFLFEPAKETGYGLEVYGVRYPDEVRKRLAEIGARYHGWLANTQVPEVFARHRMTLHVPRRFYARTLLGVPTIRVFEALACGIPLISAPWDDCEELFRPGRDYLVARDGNSAVQAMRTVFEDEDAARELADNGLETIRQRHTCAHRVDELMEIVESLAGGREARTATGRICA